MYSQQAVKIREIRIGNRIIGGDAPCFVVAEAGINHNGDIDLALKLIEEAKKAGADAIKFQKRTVRKIMTKQMFEKPYHGSNSYGQTYGEHRLRLELSESDWRRIFEHSRAAGILCFASAWDKDSVDFLEEFDIPVFKIASADLTNIPLLRYIASKQKPVILSTGMSTMEEINEAVHKILKINPQLIVMHCVSAYPFDAHLANLQMIKVLRRRYPDLVIGYSGHEKSGIVVSLGAVALGAKVIERHFTLDRHMKGSDHVASLEPHGLAELIADIRKIESALGDGMKRIYPEELPIRQKLGKSVTAARPIKKGDVITREMVTMKSPGTGLTGNYVDQLIGRVAEADITEDEQLPVEALQWPRHRESLREEEIKVRYE